MPKTKKDQAAARKPVKARGALPTPVIAPKRTHKAWYRRVSIQAAIAFGVIFVGIVLFYLIKDVRANRSERRLEVRSIEQFERKLQLLNAPLSAVFQSITTVPDQLTAGAVKPEDYRTQAQGWLDEFRKLFTGINETEVKEGLEPLAEAKALFSQGSVVMVDAGKSLLAAGSLEGQPRQDAINLGRNLLNHGGSVISMGERRIQQIKNDYDLNVPAVELPAPLIPQEEAPSPEPPVTPADPATAPVVPSAPVPSAAAPGPAAPSPATSAAP